MNNPRRALPALLSSLTSQIILLSLLLFPPSPSSSSSSNNNITPLSIISPNHHTFKQSPLLFPLLLLLHHHHHLLLLSTSLLLPFPKKRKRSHSTRHDDHSNVPARIIPRNPDSFKQLFRMRAATFEWLCSLLEPLLDARDPIGAPLDLPVEARLGIGLFRLATGADYMEIAGRFGVSDADAKFCATRLCRVLCTNYRYWVGFPGQDELELLSARFEALTGLPNCCGVVNCSRFDVENGDRRETIAGQFVVDDSSRFLSVITGFRGTRSDMRVLEASTLFEDVEKGVILNRFVDVDDVAISQYLVGHGEYNLRPWLLVPFVDPDEGSVEEVFNDVCELMSVSSLKAMASLRSWGVLSRVMKMEYKVAVACIGACSILHNMLITREDYSAFCDELDDRVGISAESKGSLGGDLVEERALVIRKALATRAKR